VPAHSGTSREDVGQHRGLSGYGDSHGAVGNRRQTDRRACGAGQSVLYVKSARNGLVGPRGTRWQRDSGRLQRGPLLCGCRSDLLLRRHLPDADPDRRQSDHRIQRLCVIKCLTNNSKSNGTLLMSTTTTTELNLENVSYAKKGAIAYVTLNRPKVLNALNKKTWEDLKTAFADAQDDAAVRGVILTGAGDKAFIAGADITELTQLTAVEADKSNAFAQTVLDLIENL